MVKPASLICGWFLFAMTVTVEFSNWKSKFASFGVGVCSPSVSAVCGVEQYVDNC